MEIFLIGYISGIVSVIAVGIFIWTIRRGKTKPTESIEGRVNSNNISTGQSLDRSEQRLNDARSINTGLGNINKSAIDRIENSKRTVSEIIAAAKRASKEKSEG